MLGLQRESMGLPLNVEISSGGLMQFLAICLLGAAPRAGFAQDASENSAASEDVSTGGYVATGLSMSNTGEGTFGEASYPSLEIGLSRGAGSLALVTGRSDLSVSGPESADNYWWEVKGAVAAPLGGFSAYGVLGFGNYLTTNRYFVEYGLGVSYS